MVLPTTSLDDLNGSFISAHTGGVHGDHIHHGGHGGQHHVSQIRVKQLKSSQNNRLAKVPCPISSVHMAKDIYRKGNTVSQSSTRAA